DKKRNRTAALAARDANRNGDDNHTSGTGVRRNEHAARECTYPDFLKCKPLNFKGTEGVDVSGRSQTRFEIYVGACPTCSWQCVATLSRSYARIAIEFATELMDKENQHSAERQQRTEET
ncbi:hypothetical protein Tco_0930822, partial [Tanacetum coccineum]